MAKLLVDEGGVRRVLALDDGSVTLGRGRENEIVIRDPKSSRHHCRVSREGDGYVLEDLNSSNGTYLNDALARHDRLSSGDVFSVGAVNVTFVTDEDASVVEAPGKLAPADDVDMLEHDDGAPVKMSAGALRTYASTTSATVAPRSFRASITLSTLVNIAPMTCSSSACSNAALFLNRA